MAKSTTKIVVIDDFLDKDDPRIVNLERHFEEVILKKTPKSGVAYIKEHKVDKLIIVLDYQFGEYEETGLWVLDEIRKESFVIPVIFLTENEDKLQRREFRDLINDRLFAFANKSNYKDLIKKVKEADIELSTKVDVALEDWINRHSPEDKDKLYLKTKNGKSYSLNNILKEIRLQTKFGQDMERKMLDLVIELLANDIKRL